MFEHSILSYDIDICATISKIAKKYFGKINLEYWYVRVPCLGTQILIRGSPGFNKSIS